MNGTTANGVRSGIDNSKVNTNPSTSMIIESEAGKHIDIILDEIGGKATLTSDLTRAT